MANAWLIIWFRILTVNKWTPSSFSKDSTVGVLRFTPWIQREVHRCAVHLKIEHLFLYYTLLNTNYCYDLACADWSAWINNLFHLEFPHLWANQNLQPHGITMDILSNLVFASKLHSAVIGRKCKTVCQAIHQTAVQISSQGLDTIMAVHDLYIASLL